MGPKKKGRKKEISKNFSQKSSKGVQDNEIGKQHTFSSCSTWQQPQGSIQLISERVKD
jgi:hypothetical protein